MKDHRLLLQLALCISLITLIIIFFKNDYNNSTDSISMTDEKQLSKQSDDINGGYLANSNSISASEWVDYITVGWNLADSFGCGNEESINLDGSISTDFYETYFGHPIVKKELIDIVNDSGFNAVRIMISWHYNIHSDGTIDVEWLKRIGEVTQYALDRNMNVIITACDPTMFYSDINVIDEVADNIRNIWGQVAEYFKEYDYKVAFENFNEVLNQPNRNDWNVTSEGVAVYNQMNQIWVDTIRRTGGNNSDRVLICNTWACGLRGIAVSEFVVPNDIVENRIIVSVHSYHGFMTELVETQLELLDECFIKKGYPVIYGEYAADSSGVVSEQIMEYQCSNFIDCANKYGIKVFYYDGALKSSYGLFDRNTFECMYPSILKGLFNPHSIGISGDDENVGRTTIVSNSSDNIIVPLEDNGIRSDKIFVQDGETYVIQLEWVKEIVRLRGIKGFDIHDRIIEQIDLSLNTRIYEYLPASGVSYFEIELWNPYNKHDFLYYQNAFDEGTCLSVTEVSHPVKEKNYANRLIIPPKSYETCNYEIANILNGEEIKCSSTDNEIQVIIYDSEKCELQRSEISNDVSLIVSKNAYTMEILQTGDIYTEVMLYTEDDVLLLNNRELLCEDSGVICIPNTSWIKGKYNDRTGVPEKSDCAIICSAYIEVECNNAYKLELPQQLSDFVWHVIAFDVNHRYMEDYRGYSSSDYFFIRDESVKYIQVYLQKKSKEEVNFEHFKNNISEAPVSLVRYAKNYVSFHSFSLDELIIGVRPNDSSIILDISQNETFIKDDSAASSQLICVENIENEIGLYIAHGSLFLYEYNQDGYLIKKTMIGKSQAISFDSNTRYIRLMGTYASHKDNTINVWYSGDILF